MHATIRYDKTVRPQPPIIDLRSPQTQAFRNPLPRSARLIYPEKPRNDDTNVKNVGCRRKILRRHRVASMIADKKILNQTDRFGGNPPEFDCAVSGRNQKSNRRTHAHPLRNIRLGHSGRSQQEFCRYLADFMFHNSVYALNSRGTKANISRYWGEEAL